MKHRIVFALLLPLLAGLALPGPLAGQPSDRPPLVNVSNLAHQIGFDQHRGAVLPLDLPFVNAHGQPVELRQYFQSSKPVLLMLVYFRCPMLCDQIMTGVTRALLEVPFSMGKDFQVVTVSFDPTDRPADALKKKAMMLQRYGRPDAARGWHFLTGSQASIHALTQAVGFRYAYDPQSKMFAHPSGILLLTPEGKISRYFFGIQYRPRDLRLGLVQASQGNVGGIADQILLLCFHYNPVTGKYDALVARLLFWGGVLILGFVAGLLCLLLKIGPKRVEVEEPAAPAVHRE